MKTAKFRVWNGTEMVYDVIAGKFGTFYVNPENSGLDHNDSASLNPANTKYPDDIPLMQFIGRKDKNGIEIYDGDILKSEVEKPMVVKWNENFASWCLLRIDWAFAHYFGECCESEDCEIIGNRYQNPELLSDII